MAKYVQINSVPNLSTGNVMWRTQEARIAEGYECWAMWGRGRAALNDHEFNFGSKAGFYCDVLQTRLDGKAGFHSKRATKRLLKKLDEINPDVVHLHNLHGYYLDIEMLFNWLAGHHCHVNWTLHDCWAFTGHCAHFTYVKCAQWKDHCACLESCPQLNAYPKTFSKVSVKWNYGRKRKLFTMLPADRMTLITPSQWLADLVADSFLNKYPVEVQHNTVDISVFKPMISDFRERYNLQKAYVILGVASSWSERKGLSEFIRLARVLGDPFVVVLVGIGSDEIKNAPKNMLLIPRVNSKEELASIYSAADVHVQPSIEESFGLTISEAQLCGTEVVVRKGTACEEAARVNSDRAGVYVADEGFEPLVETVCDAVLQQMDARVAERVEHSNGIAIPIPNNLKPVESPSLTADHHGQGAELVVILMATFNGRRYLREQIESIISQTHKNWLLYIRDDASFDGTQAIIEEYVERDSRIRAEYGEKNVGVVKNFEALMQDHVGDQAYFMLCDQDDVWLPHKIEATLVSMRDAEKSVAGPVLVYCNRDIVDEGLNRRGTAVLPKTDSLRQLLIRNHIYGCTMMLNQSLLVECASIPEFTQTHDYWIALTAVLKGMIRRIDIPFMSYRVHSANVTGGTGNFSLLKKVSNWNAVNEKVRRELLFNYRFCKMNIREHQEDELLGYLNIFTACPISRVLRAHVFGITTESLLSDMRLYYNIVRFSTRSSHDHA